MTRNQMLILAAIGAAAVLWWVQRNGGISAATNQLGGTLRGLGGETLARV